MKWKNKGNEFNELGNNFINNKNIIIIGDDFEQTNYYINKPIKDFLSFLDCHFEYINTQELTSGNFISSFLESIKILKKIITVKNSIIITHFHYNNTKSSLKLCNILKKIFKHKFIFNSVEFFEKWLSVYSAYVCNKTYVRDTCIIATTVCTLNCKYCLNFTPFIKKPEPVNIDKLKEEASIYFNTVDKVGFFQISGGEPLTYSDLGEYISWLNNNYKDKIGQILLATNGTLIPNEQLTKVLKENNVILLLDNYTKAVPRTKNTRDKLIEHLKVNGIDYRDYGDQQEFFKFFPANEDYTKWSEEDLSKRSDKCWGLQPCRNLRNGKIYYCNFSSFAVTAGIMKDDPVNYYDLTKEINKKELMEFLLGYSELGYDTFCKMCNGINIANTLERDIAGNQVSQKYDYNANMKLKEYEEITK